MIQTGTICKLGCGFLLVFHSNYGSILDHLRDKARYWSNIVIFSYPLAFGGPVRGVPLGILHIAISFGMKKTRMVGLPDGEKNVEDMCNRLHSIPACDERTDSQTDRQTSFYGIVCAMHTRRAVKTLTRYR